MSVAKKLPKKSVDEKLLKKLVPLNTLGADRLRELAGKVDVENASPGRTLFKRGDTDSKTYYLLSGELEVQLASGQNVSIKADTPAALHPLLDARPRPATAVVKTHATILVIDTDLLDILVNCDRKQSYEVNEIQAQAETDWLTRYLQSLSAMNIPVKNIEHVMRRMQELPVRAGETVIRQTDPDSQHYFVVKEGRCVVTKQAAAEKTPIRIAELAAGVGFGEEALLADQPRNASVTMLTDGRLLRLAKADFTQLIADPALHYVSYVQAQQMAQSGAVWLDTRSNAEHRDSTLIGSTNIPLMALRSKVKDLNAYGKYITFCDTGNRAAAAAFLLRQMGFSAYVLTDGLRDVPSTALHSTAPTPAKKSDAATLATPDAAPPVAPQTHVTLEQLKLQTAPADTVGEPVRVTDAARVDQELAQREQARLALAQAETEQLRAALAAARASEQDALTRLAQLNTASTREREIAKAEQARMQQHIAELKAQRAHADQTVANHQAQLRELQTQMDEYNLSLTAADAAYDSAQKELLGLSHTHERATEMLKNENTQLQSRVAATSAEIAHVKTELEREVERNRTAEEALHSAEQEIARLQAEADAAQRNAEESLRRANESESLQATILKEVQRKIESAELMRLEAEEQAQRLREAAELSRKRAEHEARKVAEAEAARAKAQEESERRARLTDEIRKKADTEVARLKKEADAARACADDAQKKSQIADAARRRLEHELGAQQAQVRAQSKPPEKPVAAPAHVAPVENDLDELERELAQLQQKLESKKRAAVARNQQAHQVAEQKRTAEPEIVQNVYDLHQKTQKLPAFKPNQPAPNDVGKVRKSGWISDSILWETTIGLREDSEAEKFLDNEDAQRATAAAATAKRQEMSASARALSSGELKSQDAKRSVFTARESAPTVQRHVDNSGHGPQRMGLIAALAAAAVAIGIGAYVLMHKTGTSTAKLTTSSPSAAPNRVTTEAPTNLPAMLTPQTSEPAPATGKSTPATNSGNGAITRKETVLPSMAPDPSAMKPKTDIKQPARKPAPADRALGATPATLESSPANPSVTAPIPAAHDNAPTSQMQESAAPMRTAPLQSVTPAATGSEPDAQLNDAPTPTEEKPVVPTFTDAPRVN